MEVDNSEFMVWISNARRGDEAARNHLFSACRSFVAVLARLQLHRRLQSKIEPSDLVQQSLLEAHRGFADFHGSTPVEWLAWLKQIVKHNAMDANQHFRQTEMRDMRKERSLEFTDSSGSQMQRSMADPGPSPSQNISKIERELQLSAAIEGLPADYRQVILLRNIERLPFDQVAERMQRSRGACQMLWMRAIEQLRSQLKIDNTW